MQASQPCYAGFHSGEVIGAAPISVRQWHCTAKLYMLQGCSQDVDSLPVVAMPAGAGPSGVAHWLGSHRCVFQPASWQY